jgi:hypothetical protein
VRVAVREMEGLRLWRRGKGGGGGDGAQEFHPVLSYCW